MLSTCRAAVQRGSDVPSVWPEHAADQKQLDAVACDTCGHARGFDNIAICSGCDRRFHFRGVMPPMSTVPSGD